MNRAVTATGFDHDVLLVGGGLANGLAALALRARQPQLRLGLIESGAHLGGNHTWSFFDSDVDEEGARLLVPLVIKRWPRVQVAFADHRRQLESPYATISAAALDRALRPLFTAPGSRLYLEARAQRVTRNQVVLADGTRLTAPLVLDGRGPVAGATPQWLENQGFQKFLGLELEVEPGAGTVDLDNDCATVMDATVAQHDGFRFMYVLPLQPGRVLVEDTTYSDSPDLDPVLLRARIMAYVQQRGLRVLGTVREERGVLGIPWSDDSVPPLGSPLRMGARGGWFHPTTGYTLPWATQVALTLARHEPAQALRALGLLHVRVLRQARFARQLNRLLFRAAAPDVRWHVLSRFYRLPQGCIERFYRLDSTAVNRARILLGRPPRGVSLRAALSALQTV